MAAHGLAAERRNEEDKKMTLQKSDIIGRSKEYREPVVVWGEKEVKVSFYAFDPESGMLKRKLVRLNRELKHIKGKRAKREYADGVASRIRDELKAGWNPWMQQSDTVVYVRWDDACDRYKEYLTKQLNEHNMRPDTVVGYLSRHKILREWVARECRNVRYAYQFDKRLVDAFLDYVFLKRDNTIRTRNNYLNWLKSFATWMMQKSFIEDDPTKGIAQMKNRSGKKNRDVIPDGVLKGIHDYLETHNRHYLLACYLLHYLFVRPREIANVKIEDFSLHNKTLLLHGDVAKNWQDAVVTLPKHVIELMLDLDVFQSPGSYYLFSDDFKPGKDFRSEKCFRDYWLKIRKDLKFSDRYKFYSLKDTGITNMLRANTDVLSVRDQARHSSILITDMYTPKDIKQANELLVRYKGVL